jgi:ankyrin repeat protein
MPITCPECGTKNLPDTARFCYHCGKPQVVTPIAEKIIAKKFFDEIENDNLDIVQQMLGDDEQLIHVRDLTVERFGAMHYAANNKGQGKVPMIELLILFGADVNATSAKSRTTPLHTATDNVANVLGFHYYKIREGERHYSIEEIQDYQNVVDTLLLYGANPNAKDSDGNTPLHIAVRGDTTLIRALCSNGADPTILNNKGITPLAEAERLVTKPSMFRVDPEGIVKSLQEYIEERKGKGLHG